ncbi:hypothetical protein C6P78_00075 [Burkholderia multivorans]|nr:hypothetical protein C6P78_00075 [Burkholderia multivorans]
MLTICRHVRLPAGIGRPAVGPVACYRGATAAATARRRARRRDGAGGVRSRNRRVRPVRRGLRARRRERAAADAAAFAARRRPTDGYEIYIFPAARAHPRCRCAPPHAVARGA